jgi:uncharacterized protein (DUF433 family)
MWTPMEPWQVAQLAHLAEVEPDRVEAALNELWDVRPDLLEQLTLAAYDQQELTADEAAHVLRISVAELDGKLAQYRRRLLKSSLVVASHGRAAKLGDIGLPVWEVVRVHRKLGSMEKLQEAFSGVPRTALEAALTYAEENAAEVERQIFEYEDLLERRLAEHQNVR